MRAIGLDSSVRGGEADTLTTGMVSISGARSRLLVALSAAVLWAACGAREPTAPPAITISTVPVAAVGGNGRLERIAGRVTGARPGQRIVLFTRTQLWWVQPFTTQPFTQIKPDATWENTVHLGNEYAALLVADDYRPPATIADLPSSGPGILAVATAHGTGNFVAPPTKTIAFSGYDWEVRQTPSDRGGANDYSGDNAWTDTNGFLHLRLRQQADHWTSAEVRLTRSLGYGTYSFVVQDVSKLDLAAAMTLLTWDDEEAGQNHREMDVEVSQWGDRENLNAQFVVQPGSVAANVLRFLAPAGRLTHSLRWEPGRASFRTVRGDLSRESQAAVATRDFKAAIPTPGNERVHMDLYYVRSAPRPPLADVEVIIERFRYFP
jgi:hypothetical protein